MRIVHFSDIHLGAWPAGFSYLVDKRLFGALNYLLRRRGKIRSERIAAALQVTRRLQPDLVVCTGDLTAVGDPAEFNLANEHLACFAADPAWTFVYIPGNHDLYVKNAACRAHFMATYERLNGGRFPFAQLPVEHCQDGVEFLLINECQPNGPLSSGGRLEVESADRLRDWLQRDRSDGVARVLLGHFPTADHWGRPLPARRRMVGGEIIRQALTEGALDVSLCGHIHHGFARREGLGGLEVCAGSLTMEGRLSVLDIDATATVQHRFEELERTSG